MRDEEHQRLEVDVQLELDRFTLQVAFETDRAVLGVFGVSGCGKSSLLETIAGIRTGARGKICKGEEVWLDRDRSRRGGVFVPPERRRIGYVPQDGLLFPDRSVLENLKTGARRADACLGSSQNGDLLDLAIELMELESLLPREVTALSGGERQRVALGRAICSAPQLLILDEPLASLDLPMRRRLLLFLLRIKAQLAIPWIFVSHEPTEIQALCDDLIVMSEGQRIARGRPDEVLTQPDVYALAERRGFENVLRAFLLDSCGGTSRVRLEGGDSCTEIVIAEVEGPPGRPLVLGLPANEIIFATTRPEGLSARNVLAAEIVRLDRCDPVELVAFQFIGGGPTLTAEVTETTTASLGLAIGGRIYVVFKATSCRVFGGQ